MALLAEHIVGRTEELGALDCTLDDLDRGRSSAVALVGEPGIGKTRLLAELTGRAEARRHLVLGGSASELERDLPFWVFIDAMEEYAQGLDPRRLATLGDAVLAELALVLPALGDVAPAREPAVQHERYRSHRAVRALLELLADTRPLVLVLDDLHWADPASIELLGALLHRPAAAPVLLALGARPRQMPAPLEKAIERGCRGGSVTRLQLDALTREQAEELLGDSTARPQAAGFYEDSGGNPFYLEQLARMLDRAGPSPAAGNAASSVLVGGVRVPPTVGAALAEELALLSEQARRVLEGASVAGDPFDPELAAAGAGAAEPAAIAALDELLTLDIVRETAVPRRFRFRHPLVRRSVYETTLGGWRLGAHERIAAALLERGAPASARAHHVELAARHGDAAAVATLRAAGEAAAQRAPASAARWFEAALRLLPATTAPQERAELLLAHSRALAATGRFADSHAALLECLGWVSPGAGGLRVRLVVECATVERLRGRHTQARARLEDAFEQLDDHGSPEAVVLMIALAADSLARTDYDGIGQWASRALAAARPLDDRVLSAAAAAIQAFAAAVSGDVEATWAQCDELASVVDGFSDEEVARRLDCLVHLSTAEMYSDRFAASERHAARALRIGRATGQSDLFPLIFPLLGTALWLQGKVAASAAVLDDGVDGARLLDNVQGLAWNLFNRALAATAAGDVELTQTLATESLELSVGLDGNLLEGHAAMTLASPLLETGQPERAASLMAEHMGGENLPAIPGAWRAFSLELLTRCELASGRPAAAARAADEAQACADMFAMLPMARGMAARARAAVALDAGDAAGAAELACASAAALESVADVYDAAVSRALAGRALAQAGAPDRAAEELERAADAFASFGSLRQHAAVEQELRRLGRRIHHRTRAGSSDELGVASLTGRELEVARLIVDRRTNAQIAATLYLSQKTVESHIRNMFRKLSVSSRVELARAVQQADRAGAA